MGQFVVDTILQLRQGIDMITMPYPDTTHFAKTDARFAASEIDAVGQEYSIGSGSRIQRLALVP